MSDTRRHLVIIGGGPAGHSGCHHSGFERWAGHAHRERDRRWRRPSLGLHSVEDDGGRRPAPLIGPQCRQARPCHRADPGRHKRAVRADQGDNRRHQSQLVGTARVTVGGGDLRARAVSSPIGRSSSRPSRVSDGSDSIGRWSQQARRHGSLSGRRWTERECSRRGTVTTWSMSPSTWSSSGPG